MKSSEEKQIKILVADDHAVVRSGIKTILMESPNLCVVGEAENGNEVLEKVQNIDLDVVLLDFDMPGKNGLDALLELKAVRPKLPVIILSIFPEDHYGMRFLKAGAAGYLSKSSAPKQLVAAVKKVAGGGKYVSPELADKLVGNLNKETETPAHELLTDREFQVFVFVASGKKLKVIADELHLSINTVSTYRTRVLKKMDMQSNADIIRYAIQNGLVK